jgi:hypothetical protein
MVAEVVVERQVGEAILFEEVSGPHKGEHEKEKRQTILCFTAFPQSLVGEEQLEPRILLS